MKTYFNDSQSHSTGIYEACATQHEVSEFTTRRVPGRLRDAVTLKTAISAAIIAYSVNTAQREVRCGTAESYERRKEGQ